MPSPGNAVKLRVSSTCVIWESPEEFRIRARILPPLPAILVGLVFCAGCYFVAQDRELIGVAVMSIIAIGCFGVASASYNFSAGQKGLRTWVSLGPVRCSFSEIHPENLVEVTTYSTRAVGGNTMYHHLNFRRKGGFGKSVIDFWSRSDVIAAATALTRWLNEHRPPGSEPVALNIDEVHSKKSRRS